MKRFIQIFKNHKTLLLFAIAALCALFGELVEKNILFYRSEAKLASQFVKEYRKKEVQLNEIIDNLSKRGDIKVANYPNSLLYNQYVGLLEKKGLAVLIYRNDSLLFVSDNAVVVPLVFSKSLFNEKIVFLQNAWYTIKYKEQGKRCIVGLIQLKQQYQINNRYLKSGYSHGFNLPATANILKQPMAGTFSVISKDDKYLFSLQFSGISLDPIWDIYVPSIAWLVSILLFFIGIYYLNKSKSSKTGNLRILVISILLIFLRIASVYWQYPSVLYKLELFKPWMFAYNSVLPSLGDALLWVIVFFTIVYTFYRNASLMRIPAEANKLRILMCFRFALLFFIWLGIAWFVAIFINNSTLSLNFSRILEFNIYSALGYVILATVFIGFSLISDKLISPFVAHSPFRIFGFLYTLISLGLYVVLYTLGFTISFFWILFFLFIGFSIGFIRLKKITNYSFSVLVFLVLGYAVFTVIIVGHFAFQREENRNRVLVSNISAEHDPLAEYLLNGIDTEIKSDTTFSESVCAENPDIYKVTAYMKRNFFEGYFTRYNIRSVTICKPTDSLYLEPPDNRMAPCYGFFQSMIKEKGFAMDGNNFYYIENQTGRTRFLGIFEFSRRRSSGTVSVFVELESKIMGEKSGYPELLLDYRYSQRSRVRNYSYAKYYSGRLVYVSGNFPYQLTLDTLHNENAVFKKASFDGYTHLFFKANQKSTIVLSHPTVTLLDWLIFLSYVFLFYFLLIIACILIVNVSIVRAIFLKNFKNKIQYTIMSILLVAILLQTGVSLFFNIKQFNDKHRQSVSEKIQSVYFELAYRFDQDSRLLPGGRLNDVLNMMSTVFYTDINIYDPSGNLISSSRSDIFSKGLIGVKMNAQAIYQLQTSQKSEVTLKERIGQLMYTSVYMPFYNSNNQLLGFINLPYFTRQEELTREISTTIVTSLNLFVILLLTSVAIAVFMASKITVPLRLIQNKFSQIKLGSKHEKIQYNLDDEIGGLVNEYNRMVIELERSVELLAKSERESAWREMAKQIAHEIKNPLTPMKLSVQHLQRAWADKNERFEEYLTRITKTLIEEIDNLSNIATEFSNFAKMPIAANEPIDLEAKIRGLVELFAGTDVKFEIKVNANCWVYADKDQLSRVFINILKNAVQSVDKGIQPYIVIEILAKGELVYVRINDNGCGIPLDLQDKLFSPNFTTKTSGMGLGLAIVKNIVEEAGGTISFETMENKGTTFIVSLPLYRNS